MQSSAERSVLEELEQGTLGQGVVQQQQEATPTSPPPSSQQQPVQEEDVCLAGGLHSIPIHVSIPFQDLDFDDLDIGELDTQVRPVPLSC